MLDAGSPPAAMTRPAELLSYDGRICRVHRCAERLVGTDECIECVGERGLQALEAHALHVASLRRIRRLLYELSDGSKTTIELVNTAGFPAADVKRLLGWLEQEGRVRLREERVGRHHRTVWSIHSAA